MKGDPTFETRESLAAWLSSERKEFNRLLAFSYPHRATERRIKRIRAAHAHLLTPEIGPDA